jgi:hypothetical protein
MSRCDVHLKANSYAHLQLTTSSSHDTHCASEIKIRATHHFALQLMPLSVLVILGIQHTTALFIDEASFVLELCTGFNMRIANLTVSITVE